MRHTFDSNPNSKFNSKHNDTHVTGGFVLIMTQFWFVSKIYSKFIIGQYLGLFFKL